MNHFIALHHTILLFAIGAGLCLLALLVALHRPITHWMMHRRVIAVYMRPQMTKDAIAGRAQPGTADMRREMLISVSAGAVIGISLISLEPMSTWTFAPRFLIVLMALYLGYRVPHMRAEQRRLNYRHSIERDLPALIDLLIIMLDAGANFDEAIARLLEHRRGADRPIDREFKRLADELAINPNRRTAFEAFATSTELNDVRLLSSVLIQSEIFGTPISRGLRSLAHDIRERQIHDIEARGGQLGPKLTVPMTLFFLPIIFIVVLAPTIIRAFHLP